MIEKKFNYLIAVEEDHMLTLKCIHYYINIIIFIYNKTILH